MRLSSLEELVAAFEAALAVHNQVIESDALESICEVQARENLIGAMRQLFSRSPTTPREVKLLLMSALRADLDYEQNRALLNLIVESRALE